MNASLGSDIFAESFFIKCLSSLRPSDVRRLRFNVGCNAAIVEYQNKMLAAMARLASTGRRFPTILALRRTEKNRYVAMNAPINMGRR
jgi:hypothetical protein